MTSAERLAETASILANGVIRLSLPQSSENAPISGESSLDFSADQSGGRAKP
ncbi:MAG: hypothetical protein ABJA60_00275 [Nitrosospira sp.]